MFAFVNRPLCGDAPGSMIPIIETTNIGSPFQFSTIFTSTSDDGHDTSDGFSLFILCK